MTPLELKINIPNIEAATKALDDLVIAAEKAEKALLKLSKCMAEDGVKIGSAYMS